MPLSQGEAGNSKFLYVAAQGADDATKSIYGPPTKPYVDSLQAALDRVAEETGRQIGVLRLETREAMEWLRGKDGKEVVVMWPYYRSRPSGDAENPDVFDGLNLPDGAVMNDVRKEGVRLGDKGYDYERAEEHGIPIPETVALDSVDQIAEGFVFNYPLVVKGFPSGRGDDVYLCANEDEAKDAFANCQEKGLKVVAQEYIEHSHGRDLRVLVANGEIVLMLGREAAPGKFKSNVSGGGRYIENPQVSDADMAVIKQVIATFPVDVAGIDFLYAEDGLVFNEINSAPGWSGLATPMADALAVMIQKRFEALEAAAV